MGRFNCKFSKKIINFLKKKFTKVDIFLSKNSSSKPSKKIVNWKGDFIFCFRSFFILDNKFIKKARFYAINFHPGPPEYRGIGCVNFSLLNNEKKYGCTSHLINHKIDNGKIINVKRFLIKSKDGVDDVLNNTYKYQFSQFKKILNLIIKSETNVKKMIKLSSKEKWSKRLYKRNNLNRLYQINIKITKKKLKKIIRATNTKNFKPFINIFGKKFIYNER